MCYNVCAHITSLVANQNEMATAGLFPLNENCIILIMRSLYNNFHVSELNIVTVYFFYPTETIYLYGGWDGNHDLADLWAYHIPSKQWVCILKSAEEEVGVCFMFL